MTCGLVHRRMRYGLENDRGSLADTGFFPVQSSVLDEEALLSQVVADYRVPEPESCRFLTRGDADIYRVKTATKNFYLKVHRPPQSLERTEAEASFVCALSASGVPVVKPIRRMDGSFAFRVSAPEGVRPILLFEEAPPPIQLGLNEELLSQIGENVALVHKAADDFDTDFGIPEMDVNSFLQERVFHSCQYLSKLEGAYLQDVSVGLEGFLQKQSRKSPEFGLCHADLVISNVRLTTRGTITLFDFGNAMKTWRALELATMYWSLGNRNQDSQEQLWEAFLRGYESIRSLPQALSERLAGMLVFRQIGFLGGNCATLPLRLGTEPFESGFIEEQMKRLRRFVEESGLLI
jgi:Ser/Thr protein kinase RdoA (MazF antagonist)